MGTENNMPNGDEINTDADQGQEKQTSEYIVEGEGDQSTEPKDKKTGMSDFQLRAALKEERKKRKSANQENASLKEEVKALRGEITSVSNLVSQQAKGPRPDPFDFSSKEEFYAALDDWNKKGANPDGKQPNNQDVKKPQPKANQQIELNEDQEFHLRKSELDLKEKLPGYEEAKESALDNLSGVFNAPAEVMETIIAGGCHTFGYDPAKVFVAFEKNPTKAAELLTVINQPAKVRALLQDLESKVKPREKKDIDVTPNPKPNQGGQVDNLTAQLKQAQENYGKSGSLKDFRAMQDIKKRQEAARKDSN